MQYDDEEDISMNDQDCHHLKYIGSTLLVIDKVLQKIFLKPAANG